MRKQIGVTGNGPGLSLIALPKLLLTPIPQKKSLVTTLYGALYTHNCKGT